MTNGGVLEKPQTKAKVIAWMLGGKSDTEIATLVSTPKRSITRQAVFWFRRRHADELNTQIEAVEQAITDYAIANKVNRIAAADFRRSLLEDVQAARAKGKTGVETGIVAKTYRMVGNGENAMLVEEYKVDTAFLAEWRANERQVAEELDQLPKGKGDINIDNRTQVLVRQYGGFDLSAID